MLSPPIFKSERTLKSSFCLHDRSSGSEIFQRVFDLYDDFFTITYSVAFYLRVHWSETAGANYYQLFSGSSPDEQADFLYSGSESNFSDYWNTEQVTYYRVQACNNQGCSKLSSEDFGYVKGVDPPGMGGLNPGVIYLLLR